MEYNFSSKPANDEVVVTYNEEIVKEGVELTEEEIEQRKKEYYAENKRGQIGGTSIAKMSLGNSMGREDRIFELREGIKSGKYLTVASAVKGMGYSRDTIIGYAKEGNITILDEEKGKWLNE